MRYCPNCGTENEETARFCKNCGQLLTAAGAAPAHGPDGDAHAAAPPVAQDLDPLRQLDLDAEPGGERLLWEGRPSRILSPRKGFTTRYRLTNERLQMITGFLSRHTEEIDLYRVNDVDSSQSFGERIFGLGDVRIEGTDRSAPDAYLRKIRNPDHVKDLVRAAARAERQRRRVLLRDEV
jgi:hypothetical protein